MAGIKKIVRPMNKAKNAFLKWLKDNNADNIDIYNPKDNYEWDYYIDISAFVNNSLYTVCFQVWRGEENIEYSDSENKYNKLNITSFLDLIN